MRTLTFIKAATLVAYLCPYFTTTQAWANKLPHTTEYGTIYDDHGASGQMRFVAPYDMEIVEAYPSCGCTGVNYPQGLLKAGEPYAISYQIDTWGRSGAFTPSIDFSLAGKSDKWQLHLKGQVVPTLPHKLNLGRIQGDNLSSIIRRIPLGRIEGKPRHIRGIMVEGKGIEASVVDKGTALVISPAANLTWGDRIVATVETTIEADGEEYARSIEVRGRVSPRFSLEPRSVSFGVGPAQRHEVRQVRVELPEALAEVPVKASPLCSEMELEVEYQRIENNILVVQVRSTGKFPAGTLSCGVEVQIGTEQVLIPVFALTR